LLTNRWEKAQVGKPDFVQIKSCASAVEAEQIRSVLEEQGVPAFVDGANTNTLLSHVGTALGGVRVFVRADDVEEALEIIESSGGASDPWYCGNCREMIEANFDLCWSCGNLRTDVEQPFPLVHGIKHDLGEAAEQEAALPDLSGYDAANPYASPRAPAMATAPIEPAGEISEEAEAMLLRAWRASIIGIVFLPFVLHLYSMYLLIRAASTTRAFTPQGEKRFYRAMAVNLLVGGTWGMILFTLFG
jgi:hypothetical protein